MDLVRIKSAVERKTKAVLDNMDAVALYNVLTSAETLRPVPDLKHDPTSLIAAIKQRIAGHRIGPAVWLGSHFGSNHSPIITQMSQLLPQGLEAGFSLLGESFQPRKPHGSHWHVSLYNTVKLIML